MKQYSLDSIIFGSQKIGSWISGYLSVAGKLPVFSPKRVGLYSLIVVLTILYMATSPIFGPINFIRTTWDRARRKILGASIFLN